MSARFQIDTGRFALADGLRTPSTKSVASETQNVLPADASLDVLEGVMQDVTQDALLDVTQSVVQDAVSDATRDAAAVACGDGLAVLTSGARRSPAKRSRGLTLLELVVVLTVLVAIGSLMVPLFGSLVDDSHKQATEATMSRVAEAIVGPGGYMEVMRYAVSDTGAPVGHASGLPWPGPSVTSANAKADHPQLHYLFRRPEGLKDYDLTAGERFYDPVNRIGWRDAWLSVTTATPYKVDAVANFTTTYGVGDGRGGLPDDDLAPIDGWGNPMVIQLPEVSTGITDEEVEHVRLISAGPNGVLDTPINALKPTKAQKNDDVVLYLFREDS